MIYLGVGANLFNPDFGPPRATCGAALEMVEKSGAYIERRAPWYESAPVPASDQPWYVNGVVAVTTSLTPGDLMSVLLDIEDQLGRRRRVRNAPRTVDLDILAYHDEVLCAAPEDAPTVQVPHPRMHERSFVINPLFDICPNWIHPKSGRSIGELKAALPADQVLRRMADAHGVHGTEWGAAEIAETD